MAVTSLDLKTQPVGDGAGLTRHHHPDWHGTFTTEAAGPHSPRYSPYAQPQTLSPSTYQNQQARGTNQPMVVEIVLSLKNSEYSSFFGFEKPTLSPIQPSHPEQRLYAKLAFSLGKLLYSVLILLSHYLFFFQCLNRKRQKTTQIS